MFSRFRAVLIIWLGLGIFFWGTHVPHVLAGKPEDETDNDEPVDSIENSRPEGFFQAKKANDAARAQLDAVQKRVNVFKAKTATASPKTAQAG